ncbi:ketopantoate reductase family protein [Niallia sp. 01092]|uniref:ketopantoate reductase family protein n=1 Tax=unclassified Niallia TaxID=2837522 RepID=UPI003FD5349A
MTTIKKIAIVGLGAIGSVYGDMLQKTGEFQVKAIVDQKRKERYEQTGIYVNNELVSLSYITPEEVGEAADLIIVSVKYGQLGEAISAIKHHVGENTTILSLLNGITSEEELAAVYGKEKIVYAMCNGIDSTRDGNSIFCSNPGKISFGEKKNYQITERVQQIKACFEQGQIPVEVPEDMERTLWYKFMINVGMNQVSAVTRSPYGFFQQPGFARDLAMRAMKEVIALAKAQNIDLKEKDMEDFFDNILSKISKDGKTSMLQDIEAKRLTEVSMFSEKVIDYGKRLNIDTPVNQTLYEIIRTVEAAF